MGNFLVDLGRGGYDVQQSNLLTDQHNAYQQNLILNQAKLDAVHQENLARQAFQDYINAHPDLKNNVPLMAAFASGDLGGWAQAMVRAGQTQGSLNDQANAFMMKAFDYPVGSPEFNRWMNAAKYMRSGVFKNPQIPLMMSGIYINEDPNSPQNQKATQELQYHKPFTGTTDAMRGGNAPLPQPPNSGGGMGSYSGGNPYAGMTDAQKQAMAQAYVAQAKQKGVSDAEIAKNLSDVGLAGYGGVSASPTPPIATPLAPPWGKGFNTTIVGDGGIPLSPEELKPEAAPATEPAPAPAPSSTSATPLYQFQQTPYQTAIDKAIASGNKDQWVNLQGMGGGTRDPVTIDAKWLAAQNDYANRQMRLAQQQREDAAKLKIPESQLRYLDTFAFATAAADILRRTDDNPKIKNATWTDALAMSFRLANQSAPPEWQDHYLAVDQFNTAWNQLISPYGQGGAASGKAANAQNPIAGKDSMRPMSPKDASTTARQLVLDKNFSASYKQFKSIIDNAKLRGADVSKYKETFKILSSLGVGTSINSKAVDAFVNKYK